MISTGAGLSLLPAAPYRGLEPYRFCDQVIFFERELEAERLLRLVTMYRGSLLYGESGAEKSSLINAGFLPKTIAAGFAVERVRVQPRSGHEFVVERIPRSDSDDDVLPSRLIQGDPERRSSLPPEAFVAAVRGIAATTDLLLIFDQFEELLTLATEQAGDGGAIDSQRKIIETLVSLLHSRSLDRLRVLFVFREDYLAKFDKLFYYCPELPDRFMRLTPPSAAALHRLLRGPFETELVPPGHWTHTIPEPVLAKLEAQLRPAEEGRALKLAQVQIAALQLWRADDPAALLASQGVDGLVREFITQRLNTFGKLREVAEALLSVMITRQGTRKVVAETDAIDELGREDGVPEAVARQTLERLVTDTRLVRRDFNRGTTTYEIVSEFLVPWIRTMKIQRAARQTRRVWLKRATTGGVVIATLLGGVYYWKYTTLTRDELVRQAHQALAMSEQRSALLSSDNLNLRQALQLQGSERERKLAQDLQVKSTQVDQLKTLSDQQAAQLTNDRTALATEKEGRTSDQRKAAGTIAQLESQLVTARDRIRALEARPEPAPSTGTDSAAKSAPASASAGGALDTPPSRYNGFSFLKFNDLVALPWRGALAKSDEGLLREGGGYVFLAKAKMKGAPSDSSTGLLAVIVIPKDTALTTSHELPGKTRDSLTRILRLHAPSILARYANDSKDPEMLAEVTRTMGELKAQGAERTSSLVSDLDAEGRGTATAPFESGGRFVLELDFHTSPPLGVLLGILR